MPEGRMVSKSISHNVQLARVSLEADYLFGRCIPHLDREGRMVGFPALVKATACPLRPEITVEAIPELLQSLSDQGLVRWYEVDGKQVLEFPGFRAHNRGMKLDREAPSRLPAYPSNNGADLLRTNSGPSPDLVRLSRREVKEEVEVEEEVEGEGLSASSPAVLKLHAGDPLEKSINDIITAANRGMMENPAIGNACHPIPHGHGSRQVVSDWLADGIPAEIAASVVYQRAKAWVKTDRRKQISTMSYFDGAVRDEGDKHRARVSSPPSEQKPAATLDNSDLARWKRANPEKYEQFEKEVIEDLQRYPWWEETRDKQKEIRDRLTERIWPKPAVAER